MRHAAYQDGKALPAQYSKPFSEIQLFPTRLQDPLKIKKPSKIFVNSMSDLFHSETPEWFIKAVFDTMREAHWHTFQILTKRAGRLRRLGPQLDWPANVWMGVSIENDSLTPRANALRECGARVKFLSCEPLLEALPSLDLAGIDQVIVGGESGAGARPFDPAWARELRARCEEKEIAFFMKQFGEAWAREVRAKDRHGGEMEEWPEDLRVRQFPFFEEVYVNTNRARL
jgi:protein gp37